MQYDITDEKRYKNTEVTLIENMFRVTCFISSVSRLITVHALTVFDVS